MVRKDRNPNVTLSGSAIEQIILQTRRVNDASRVPKVPCLLFANRIHADENDGRQTEYGPAVELVFYAEESLRGEKTALVELEGRFSLFLAPKQFFMEGKHIVDFVRDKFVLS